MGTPNPGRQGARELYGAIAIGTPDGDSAMDDANDAVRVAIVAGAGSGGTASTDDGAFSVGSGSGTPAMGIFSADTVDAGDVGVLAMDASRRLLVSIEADNAGIGGGVQYDEGDTDASITGTAILWEDAGNTLTTVSAANGLPVNVVASSAGGASATDDDAFSLGSDSVAPMGALVDETAPDSADEGDVGIPRMTADRKLLSRIVGATDANRLDVDSSGHAQVDIAAASVTVPVDGSGVTQPVSGTVTAELGATDNAVLDQIEVNTSYGDRLGGGTESGVLRVTLASNSTGVLSVDDNDSSLTVDNGGTFAVQESGGALTALQLLDDIVYTDDTSTHATGTSRGALIMAAATPSDGAVGANDIGAVAMSLDRRLLVDAQIAGQDAALTVDGSGVTQPVSGTVTANAGSGTFTVDGSGVTQPVSGTVTANLSATDNAVLDQIELNTDFGAVTGGGAESGALRVTLANDSTGVVTVDDGGSSLTVDGTITANLSATDNAVIDQIELNTDFGVVVGGGTEATALRVTIANNSTGVLSVDDNGSTLSVDDGSGSLTVDNAALSVTGGGTETGALRVTLANNSTGVVSIDDNGGSVTVDGTVTANLGATDNAVLDDIAANTDPAATTATLANVNDSASNVTLQASNANRLGWVCYNDSTEILYIKWGATATTTSFTDRVMPQGRYELPSFGSKVYTGIVDGIWAANGSGAARVTELTA